MSNHSHNMWGCSTFSQPIISRKVRIIICSHHRYMSTTSRDVISTHQHINSHDIRTITAASLHSLGSGFYPYLFSQGIFWLALACPVCSLTVGTITTIHLPSAIVGCMVVILTNGTGRSGGFWFMFSFFRVFRVTNMVSHVLRSSLGLPLNILRFENID